MNRYSFIIFSLTSLLSTACGQPGPLYLPAGDPGEQVRQDAKTEKPKDLQEQTEPKSEPQTDQYYPY